MFVDVKAPVHESRQFIPGTCKSRGYEGKYVGVQRCGFGNFGMYLFGRCLDIPLEQLFYLSGILGNKYGLAIGIKPGPSRSSCHLMVLACRNRLHSLTRRKTEIIAYDDPPGREVQPRSKGWR